MGRLFILTTAAASLLLTAACSAPSYPPPGRTPLEPIAPRVSAAPAGTAPASTRPAQSARPAAQALTTGTPVPAKSERSGARDIGSTLRDKKERWWPEWSDPANWFLEERYRL